MLELTLKRLFPGVYSIENDSEKTLVTINLTPRKKFYTEQLIIFKGIEYRTWNPFKSKLAAAIRKGLKEMPITRDKKILYLGVASGTTCSHISDIIGMGGHIWGVDFASRPVRDLIEGLAKHRNNVSPILGDARYPKSYAVMLPRVDIIYSDVAQPDQADIVIQNSRILLKPGGWILLAVKSRSIDVIREPHKIYDEEINKLKKSGFKILESLILDPFEKDHAFVIAKYLT